MNRETLAFGGNNGNGTVYLINILSKQLFNISHIDNCSKIICIKSIDINNIIISSFDSNNKKGDFIV